MNNFKVGDIVYPKENAKIQRVVSVGNRATTKEIRDTNILENISDIMFTSYILKNMFESIYALDCVTVPVIEEMAINCNNTLKNIIELIGDDLTADIEE